MFKLIFWFQNSCTNLFKLANLNFVSQVFGCSVSILCLSLFFKRFYKKITQK